MAKTDFKSVNEYIATHPEDVQATLQRVRITIRKALPGADEVISYQIPAYKLHGGAVVYFSGWKLHYSLHPAGDHLVEAFRDELAAYKISKGTIRFPLSQPVPVKLIERIVKFRAAEAGERARAKLGPPKKSAKQGNAVDQFLSELRHARKDEVEAVRSLIMRSNKEITERIKWNAPSFCFKGDDRVTMRLQPKDRVQLIFHRGAKAKDTHGFEFEDSTGLLEWLAADRAVVTLEDMKDTKAKTPALVRLVRAWMKATT